MIRSAPPDRRGLALAISLLALVPARRGMAQLEPDSRRACAICHLEWVDSFQRTGVSLLIERPTKPVAPSSSMCLSCHDGSVVDSRRRVWLDHSHKTDVKPPPGMNVPAILPLEDGKITCRTCHTAHAGKGSDHLDAAFFLRIPDDASQLCVACHGDKMRGPALGSHPIGGMPWPVPDELIKAGAKAVPGQRQIYCQVCHLAHGSSQDKLLVMGVGDNQLCLTCHKKLRPRMWRPAREGVHPDRPVVKEAEQLAAIRSMGTRLGTERRLICLSCHKLHDGKSGRFMLARPLEGSGFCIQCHSGMAKLLSTDHDLRKSAPGSMNRLGMTPEKSGPCGSCHLFHNLAIRPRPSERDPEGVCASCHRPDGAASKRAETTYTHPVNVAAPAMPEGHGLPLRPGSGGGGKDDRIVCLTCHNPHDGSHPGFVRGTQDSLCASCHADLSRSLSGGPHHATAGAKAGRKAWPTTVPSDGRCAGCHLMHGSDPARKLWTFVPAKAESYSDGLCLGCHGEVGWPSEASGELKEVMHPRSVLEGPRMPHARFASVVDPETKEMICRTCHNPHAGGGHRHLLRVEAGARASSLCVGCHEAAGGIEWSLHSERALRASGVKGGDPAACGPCHAVHAVQGSMKEMLWACPLGQEGGSISARRCLGCHKAGGVAKAPHVVKHPEAPMRAVNWASFYAGRAELEGLPPGEITCITCHLPHGKRGGGARAATSAPGLLAATKPMLRPRIAEVLCSSCHGFDAARLHLYYHFPEKRGGVGGGR
ncbi:MAG: cytochrome c3 family protein [Phycisphaerae bacterium]|nr:cytochrome c3 family protein [Phycisphaerae bacterium]